MKHEEMLGLLKEVEESSSKIVGQGDRSILADWIKDNPEMVAELLAEIIRRLPHLLTNIIEQNLKVKCDEKVDFYGGHRGAIVTISVEWDGRRLFDVEFNT